MTKIEAWRWLAAVQAELDQADDQKDMEAGVFFLFWYRELKKFLGLPMGSMGFWPKWLLIETKCGGIV